MRHRLQALTIAFALLALAGACDEVEARRHIQDGNKAYNSGKYDRAVTEYTAAITSHPELSIGWYNLGLAHLAMFQPGLKDPRNDEHAQGAIRAFQEYMKRYPDDNRARDWLLSTYIDSGHYEGALDYFRQKYDKDPTDMQALAQLAQINAQAGNFEEANKWHQTRAKAETSVDGKADAWYSMGVLDWRRLNNRASVQGSERARIADEGLYALQQADATRKDHQATITYTNLLYRERAMAHEAGIARIVDLASAQLYYKRAVDIARRTPSAPGQPGPAPGKPGTPGKPGKPGKPGGK